MKVDGADFLSSLYLNRLCEVRVPGIGVVGPQEFIGMRDHENVIPFKAGKPVSAVRTGSGWIEIVSISIRSVLTNGHIDTRNGFPCLVMQDLTLNHPAALQGYAATGSDLTGLHLIDVLLGACRVFH